ncbi:MAG: DUF2182 domain-containing protein [Hyphomicrobiales bacterium]|nr:DUF2182 domain-containing protein [Hyphomicrobiales bacterium]
MTEYSHDREDLSADDRYAHLDRVDRGLAEAGRRPKLTVYVFTAIAVTVAWVWLVFMTAGVSQSVGPDAVGPGMSFWQGLLERIDVKPTDGGFLAFILKICTPLAPSGFTLGVFFSTFLMWMAMSLAMMLPSAGAMIRTYGDIADVAAQKGEPVVPLFVLVLGYLTVWAAFSLAMSFFQLLLIGAGLAADPVFPVQGIVAAVILLVAGAYQFSALKDACLTKCRNPFAILFGRWSPEVSGIYKLGMEQGLYCLGCCWALMLVMLVVGTMNLAWMAFFTLFAIVEKSGRGRVTSTLSGGILLAWGGILLVVTLMQAQ